jgi:predicted Zn-dependent protease
MASFLRALNANDALQQREAGRGGEEESALAGWFRSHPRTPERIERAAQAVSAELPQARATDRQPFLAAIDGMIYGEDPAQGFVRGRSFQHPGLRIAFEAPTGFRLQNTPEAVIGTDGQGRFMTFDMAKSGAGDLRAYLQREWVPNQELQDLQSLMVSGQPAAVGFGRVSVSGRPAMAMFSAVRGADGNVYRLLYAKSAQFTRADVAAFEQSLRSFRPLSAAEAAKLQPTRVQLVTVKPGDTIDTFTRQMEVEQDPRGLFVLLNGLDRGRSLEPGDQVKVLKRG